MRVFFIWKLWLINLFLGISESWASYFLSVYVLQQQLKIWDVQHNFEKTKISNRGQRPEQEFYSFEKNTFFLRFPRLGIICLMSQ